jgi:septum formation protein
MQKIYLASNSPRRKELLKQIRLNFEIIQVNYKEDMTLSMKPVDLAKYLSRGKAKIAAKKIKSGLIISADTFISLGGEILGKPHTKEQAKITLKKISGKILGVISGFSVIDAKTKKTISKAVCTKVYIKKLSEREIDNYIKTAEPLDKAGAFGIQGLGALIVKKIEGDYNGIVGLPLYELGQTLKKFGIEII